MSSFKNGRFLNLKTKPLLLKVFINWKIIKSTDSIRTFSNKWKVIQLKVQNRKIGKIAPTYLYIPLSSKGYYLPKRFFGKTFAQKPFRNNCLLMAFYDCGFLVRASNCFYRYRTTNRVEVGRISRGIKCFSKTTFLRINKIFVCVIRKCVYNFNGRVIMLKFH